MNSAATRPRSLIKKALPFALALTIWFMPVPAGLTTPAWHLFAIFASAIFAVILNAFPLLTSAMLAVAATVLSGTVDPVKAFSGFANSSVLLVVVAFLVASAVVKCGLGRRISLYVVRAFGRTTLGTRIQHFPDRRAGRAGVSEQYGARRRALSGRPGPRPGRRLGARRRKDAPARRLPDVLRHREPQRLVGPLAHGDLGQPDRRVARRALRPRYQLRVVAHCRLRSGADDDPPAALRPVQGVSAGRAADDRRAGQRARGARSRWGRCRGTKESSP